MGEQGHHTRLHTSIHAGTRPGVRLRMRACTQVGKRQAVYTGLALGAVNGIMYCTYAVAFYYGAWRVSTGNYTGGQVLQVFVAALVGGFSLGQVRAGAPGWLCVCACIECVHEVCVCVCLWSCLLSALPACMCVCVCIECVHKVCGCLRLCLLSTLPASITPNPNSSRLPAGALRARSRCAHARSVPRHAWSILCKDVSMCVCVCARALGCAALRLPGGVRRGGVRRWRWLLCLTEAGQSF